MSFRIEGKYADVPDSQGLGQDPSNFQGRTVTQLFNKDIDYWKGVVDKRIQGHETELKRHNNRANLYLVAGITAVVFCFVIGFSVCIFAGVPYWIAVPLSAIVFLGHAGHSLKKYLDEELAAGKQKNEREHLRACKREILESQKDLGFFEASYNRKNGASPNITEDQFIKALNLEYKCKKAEAYALQLVKNAKIEDSKLLAEFQTLKSEFKF